MMYMVRNNANFCIIWVIIIGTVLIQFSQNSFSTDRLFDLQNQNLKRKKEDKYLTTTYDSL